MKRIRVEMDKCTGCRICEAICSLIHSDGTINPRNSYIRIFKDDEEGINFPIIYGTSNQIDYVKAPVLTIDGKGCNIMQFLSLFKPSEFECNFCGNCVRWCVTGALFLIKEE